MNTMNTIDENLITCAECGCWVGDCDCTQTCADCGLEVWRDDGYAAPSLRPMVLCGCCYQVTCWRERVPAHVFPGSRA